MKRLITAVLLAVLGVGLLAPVALAWDTAPDSMSVVSCRVYEDLAEEGDVALVFYWNLAYSGNYTTTPASEAIMFQFLDTDGTTVLSTATPYVFASFQTNGYGWGVSGFYFSAADNLTWGAAYSIRIVQSPVYFETPTSNTYSIQGTDWMTGDDQAGLLKTYVLQLCDLLTSHYTNVVLKISLQEGIFLNAYGEGYFRAAIPGLQVLCPLLFSIQYYDPESFDNPTPYDMSLQETYSVRLEGSEIKRGADRIGETIGLTGYFVLGLLCLVGCIGLGIFTQMKGWGLEVGLGGAAILCVGFAVWMGNAAFTMVMIASLVAVIAIMFQFFHKRA